MSDDVPVDLVNGGDCTLHFHSADRVRTHDDLARLHDLEVVVPITANYAARGQDDVILCDTTGGAITVTLLAANRGQRVTLLRTAGAANVTVTPAGTDTVNGAATATINTSYVALRLKARSAVGWYNA